MLLFGDLHRMCIEISIIPPAINGRIYIHLNFKFYIHRSNAQPLILNPIYIYLGYDNKYELKKYSEGIQSMLYVLKIFHIPFYFIFES